MTLLRTIVILITAHLLAGHVHAIGCGEIVFDGQGAGQVVFSVAAHARKGATCAECHEWRGLMPPLFEMKVSGDNITMRSMEKGSSCGHCHDGSKAFSASAGLDCDRCHHK